MAAVYSVFRVSLLHQYIESVDGIEKSISTIPYAFNVAFSNVDSFNSFFIAIWDFIKLAINFKALGIGIVFGISIFAFKKHTIVYIIFGAFLGICFQMYEEILI